LVGRSLEARVARLGAGTLLVTEVVGRDAPDRASLGEMLAPLARDAELIAFRQLPVTARDAVRGECLVLAYGRETLVALAPALAAVPPSSIYCVTADLPPGLPLEVEIDGAVYPTVTIEPPAWAARLPLFKPLLIMSEEFAERWTGRGHFEFCLLLA